MQLVDAVLMRIHLVQAEACADQGCSACAAEAAYMRRRLAQVRESVGVVEAESRESCARRHSIKV